MRVIVGIGLLFGGAVVAFGGITGRLAPMLAALAYPGWLSAPTGDFGAPPGATSANQQLPGIPVAPVPGVFPSRSQLQAPA